MRTFEKFVREQDEVGLGGGSSDSDSMASDMGGGMDQPDKLDPMDALRQILTIVKQAIGDDDDGDADDIGGGLDRVSPPSADKASGGDMFGGMGQ